MWISNKKGLIVIVAATGIVVAACGGNQAASDSHSKPALKVNGHVIGEAELQIKAGLQNGYGTEKLRRVSPEVIENMVNSELMRQAAVEAGLDKDPLVSARVADMTRRILGLAYVDQLIRSIKTPTQEEIQAYYNAHPDLYAERMQYTFQEMHIQSEPGQDAEVRGHLKENESLKDFESWLTAKNIPHRVSSLASLGDQLPEGMEGKIKALQPGGHVMIEGKGESSLRVLFLQSRQKAALDMAQANTIIATRLRDQLREEALGKTTESLRGKAKIEYMAPYTASGFNPGS